ALRSAATLPPASLFGWVDNPPEIGDGSHPGSAIGVAGFSRLLEAPSVAIPHASTALDRFTVLDLTRVRAGPTAVRQPADWGANVIKIDAPEEGGAGEPLGGARRGPDFQNLHRNKRAITLNLKEKAGVEAFYRLVKKADVVVENFRPDVKERLG